MKIRTSITATLPKPQIFSSSYCHKHSPKSTYYHHYLLYSISFHSSSIITEECPPSPYDSVFSYTRIGIRCSSFLLLSFLWCLCRLSRGAGGRLSLWGLREGDRYVDRGGLFC